MFPIFPNEDFTLPALEPPARLDVQAEQEKLESEIAHYRFNVWDEMRLAKRDILEGKAFVAYRDTPLLEVIKRQVKAAVKRRGVEVG